MWHASLARWSCLLTTSFHRNAIGSSHNVPLARSHAVDWNVTLKPGTSYLSHGPNLYQRERRVHLAGEVITPNRAGGLTSTDPQYPSLFSSKFFAEQTEEKGS